MAALREAIGLGCNETFDVADGNLPALVENFDKEQLIATALATRGEMAQVMAADQVVDPVQMDYLVRKHRSGQPVQRKKSLWHLVEGNIHAFAG